MRGGIESGKAAENQKHDWAKRMLLEELSRLSTTFDEGNFALNHKRLWAEQITKIEAGEKLSQTEATTMKLALEAAHHFGLSGKEFDAFINELFIAPRNRREDEDW